MRMSAMITECQTPYHAESNHRDTLSSCFRYFRHKHDCEYGVYTLKITKGSYYTNTFRSKRPKADSSTNSKMRVWFRGEESTV